MRTTTRSDLGRGERAATFRKAKLVARVVLGGAYAASTAAIVEGFS